MLEGRALDRRERARGMDVDVTVPSYVICTFMLVSGGR